MFTEQLSDLDYINNLPRFVCLVGHMNIQFDNPLQSLTNQTLTTLSLCDLVQVINKTLFNKTGLLFDLKMASIKILLLQTIIALIPTSTFQSLNLLPYTGLLGT